MRLGGVAAAVLALILASSPPGMTEAASRLLSFKDLKGWARDDQSTALAVFRKSCGEMAGAALGRGLWPDEICRPRGCAHLLRAEFLAGADRRAQAHAVYRLLRAENCRFARADTEFRLSDLPQAARAGSGMTAPRSRTVPCCAGAGWRSHGCMIRSMCSSCRCRARGAF